MLIESGLMCLVIMGPNEQTTKIESATGKKEPNIDRLQQHYMKLLEEQNQERVKRLVKLRRNNLIVASALGGAVFGIYFYSMFAVKQERFLDDFEEPAKEVN